MSSKTILIYAGGNLVGNAEIDDNYDKALTSVIVVDPPNSESFNIFYVGGMDYGIILPNDIAERIKNNI